MTCCELCSEITECTQSEVHGELTCACQNCQIAEHLAPPNRVKDSVGLTGANDEFEETLI